jgi:neutral ceramidase
MIRCSVFCFLCLTHAFAAEPIKTGFAMTDITPPVGYRRAGGYSEELSTGVQDPLKAKAMVLQQGSACFGLVMTDLLSMPEELADRVRDQFSQTSGVPRGNIVAAGTHSHGSPEHFGPLRDIFHAKAMREQGKDSAESIDYPALLVARCVEALSLAWERREPAVLKSGITELGGMAFNRRYHMRDGSVRFNPGKRHIGILRAAGPVDTDFPLLFAESSAAQRPLGLFTTFAMHTAVFGGSEFSADFPGHLQRELREKLGEDGVSIFAEGCAGDTNHVNTATREPDPTPEQIGKTLAETVKKALPGLVTVTEPSLAVLHGVALAPMRSIDEAQHAAAQAKLAENKAPFLELVDAWRLCHRMDIQKRYGGKKPMEITTARLNADTALVCLPHEVFVEIGLAIKAASPFRRTTVISLANGVDYYIPTRRAFEEGSYEVTTCPLEPGCGELLIDEARRLLWELKR